VYHRAVWEAELTDSLRLGPLASFLTLPTRRRIMTTSPLVEVIASCLEGAGVAQWGIAACPGEPWPHAPALPRAVSIGVALAPEVIGHVETGPTPAYFADYQRVNGVLWEAAQQLAAALRAHGAVAEPLRPTIGPTVGDKQAVDMTHAGVFAHKTAATQAGLGWIGKTAIFVSPRMGPWLRLTTVFTDAELASAGPITEGGCAKCRRCVDACPAGAGRDTQWHAGMPRAELLDVVACMNENDRHVDAGGLCGICVSACPFGRRLLRG
jgi:epoxyqueuosine reductase QueG